MLTSDCCCSGHVILLALQLLQRLLAWLLPVVVLLLGRRYEVASCITLPAYIACQIRVLLSGTMEQTAGVRASFGVKTSLVYAHPIQPVRFCCSLGLVSQYWTTNTGNHFQRMLRLCGA